MEDFAGLPASVAVCTNVIVVPPLPPKAITNAELVECFLNARRSSTHTQPLPSNPREVDKLLERLDNFHSSQLAPFLYGYTYPNATIPDSVLDPIRALCVNADPDWAYKCQLLAFDMLSTEVHLKAKGLIPRPRLDDPIALAQMRQVLPGVQKTPKVAFKQCHFKYVGSFSEDATFNEKVYGAVVKLQNKGDASFTIEVSQTQTVIDGIKVENRFIESSLSKQSLGAGESIDIKLSVKEAPRTGFTEFQQLLVLSIDGVLKLFVTYAVISPRQGLFGQRFPACLPLVVQNSSIGAYNAPLMLQVLKHVFIRQQGLSSRSAMHLMCDKAANYRAHNQETMREAIRAKDILREQMNLTSVLESFWLSLPDAKKAPPARRFKPPVSSAQPAGYLPGIDLPTGSTSTAAAFFPNAFTKLPDYLAKAPPDVTMGLILIWLAEMDVEVFSLAFTGGDSTSYLESLPPYLRGIVMWIVDLCCALLQNKAVNGATERGLAATFASVLTRSSGSAEDAEAEMDEVVTEAFATDAFAEMTRGRPANKGRAFTAEVALRQHAITSLLNWIRLYNTRFERAL